MMTIAAGRCNIIALNKENCDFWSCNALAAHTK